MSDERHSVLGSFVTFLTGAAIGAGLALLFAPQSGEETRKKIKDMGDKVSDEVKDNYDKVSKETQKAIQTVKETSDKALVQIKSFIEGARETIKKEAAQAEKPPVRKKA